MEFSSSYAVFILLPLLPIFTTPTSILNSNMENVGESKTYSGAARFLENSVNGEWKIYDADGFTEYDFCNKACVSEECKVAVNPCDDFYRYACGNWPKNNRNATDPSILLNSMKLRDIQNDKEIIEFLEQNNAEGDPEAVRKARQLYSNCANPESYDGIQLPKQTLLNIGLPETPHYRNTSNSKDEYVSTIAKTNKIAGTAIFTTIVGVNPYDHNENAIWILKPPSSYVLLPLMQPKPEAQARTEVNIGKSFGIFCDLESRTVKIDVLKQITEREMITGKASTTFNSSFRSNIYTLKELQKITDDIGGKTKLSIPKFNWTKYFVEIFEDSNVYLDLKNDSNVQIIIDDMQYIRDKVNYIHKQTDILEIERELRCHAVGIFLPYTQLKDFQRLYEIPSNASQKEVCSAITTRSFRMAVGYMYSKKEKYNSAKIQINITRNFLASMMSIVRNQVKVNLGKLNQINEKWTISPTTVNAFHIPLYNSITVPAALLGPPLYTDSLKSLIYGSIGSIVGHEISHGFDRSNGRKFNSAGVLEDWWNNKSCDAYEEKSKCFVKAYDSYASTFQGVYQKGNSTLTLDEDISDNAGFEAALFAHRSYILENGEELPLYDFANFTSDQLFVLGFANFRCESPTNSISDLAPKLAHSPNGVRVNGVLKNSREFATIWNCPKGTNMNLPDQKCSLF